MSESMVRRLTQERIEELKKQIRVERSKYRKLKSTVEQIMAGELDDMDCEVGSHNRAWKKSIMILWKQVASHRYASLFLQPVTNDIAPNYSDTVYRAMDLATLKKNLETGVVRTTSDFQRDLMLMFQNALMYNNHEHDVYKMALEMQNDVMAQVAQFLATQLMVETTQPVTPKGLRRSTLRRSVMSSEKVSEARSKRTAAIEGELKFMKKKTLE
uniref:Bromo domain-containing protein n=2 Tax=Ciona savignyi TaxID=51511 RepID=H2YQE5_CIOSA